MSKNQAVNIVITGDTKQLKTALGQADGEMKSFGDKVGGFAGKLKGLALVGGAAGAAALGVGFINALDVSAGTAKLAAQLGLTGAESEKAGRIAGDLYADAYGSSLDEVNAAVGAVASSLTDLSDTAGVERLSAKAMDLAAAFEIDVTEGINAASIAVNSGLADDADHAIDLIVAAMQKMPAAMRGELLEASNEYGQFFAAMGFSGEQAFGMLAKAAEDGMYGIDKTGDAIKELSIRATDMSNSTRDAYFLAGLDAEEMATRFLAGGESAHGALQDVIVALKNIQSPVDQATAAIGLFGTPLEDLGVTEIPKFLDSLSGMTDTLGDVGGAASEMGDTLNDNLATKIEGFRRKGLQRLTEFVGNVVIPAIERLEPVVAQVAGWFQREAVPALERFGEAARDVLQPAFEAAASFVTGTLLPGLQRLGDWLGDNKEILAGVATAIGVGLVVAFAAWAKAAAIAAVATIAATWPILAIGAAIAALVAGILWAYNNIEPFRNAIDTVGRVLRDNVWPVLKQVGGFLAGAFADAVKAAGSFITQTLWPALQRVGSAVASVVVPALQRAGEFITGTVVPAFQLWVDVIRTAAAWLIDNLGPVVSELATLIGAVFDRVVQITQASWTVISTVIGAAWTVISAIVSAAWAVIWPIIEGGLSVLTTAWSAAWSIIQAVVPPVWNAIQGVVETALGVVQGVIRTVTGIISGDWGRIWSGIQLTVGSVWRGIQSAVSGAIDAVKRTIGTVMRTISDAWNRTWNGARDRVSSVFRSVTDTVSGAMESARSTVSSMLDRIGGLFSGVQDTIRRALSGIADVASAPFKAAGDAIKRAWNNSIGGKGISVPDIPGLPGRGQRFEIPRLHTGIARVPGIAGSEFPAILEAGESVRSRRQEDQLQMLLGRAEAVVSAQTVQPAQTGASIVIDMRGAIAPTSNDVQRMVVAALEAAVGNGARLPRTARVLAS